MTPQRSRETGRAPARSLRGAWAGAWAGVWMAALLAACGPADRAAAPEGMEAVADGGTAMPVQELESVTQEGPVQATVTLAPRAPRLGDPLTLELSVTAEPGVTVEMPQFGEALGRFSILDFAPRRETAADGGTVEGQRYTLQAPMSGRLRIPALRVEYVDERGGTSGAWRELLTDEIPFEVASVLPEGAAVDALLPPRPALPEIRAGWWVRWWPVVLALALVAGAGVWAYALWQRRAVERVRLTAHERALGRLRALEARGFPRGAEADAWYVELSDIVRRYVEDRYAVRAPELTTEEFLVEAGRSFSGPHRDLLGAFLERCDRVKFARYSPDRQESRDAWSAARQFLDETRADDAPDHLSGGRPAPVPEIRSGEREAA